MFKTETRGAILELSMERAPVNAVNREWIDGFGAVPDDLGRQENISVLLIRSTRRYPQQGEGISRQMRVQT